MARRAELVNPIDKLMAHASATHEAQQLQRGDGSKPPGPTRQRADVHATCVVRDHRHHQLVVMALKLHMDALVWSRARGWR